MCLNKIICLFPWVALLIGGLSLHGGETFRWNGAGVLEGTGSNDWGEVSNWLLMEGEELREAERLPGSGDLVEVKFRGEGRSFPGLDGLFAFEIPGGVELGGMVVEGVTSRRPRIRVGGDVTMETLELSMGSSNDFRTVFQVEEGAVLKLTGGSVDRPTLYNELITGSGPRDGVIYGRGTVELSGEDIYYQFHQGLSGPDLRVVQPEARFRFLPGQNRFKMVSGAFEVPEGIRFFDVPEEFEVGGGFSMWVMDEEGQRMEGAFLEGFGNTYFYWQSTINGNVSLPGGEYGAINTRNTMSGSSSTNLTFYGPVVVRGEADSSLAGESFAEESPVFSLLLHRDRSETSGSDSVLNPRGHSFQVLSEAPVFVGDPNNDTGGSLSHAGIRARRHLQGTPALEFHPDLIVGVNGFLDSDAHAIWILRGNFINRSNRNEQFSMDTATLQLLGGGVEPQRFELQGEDRGTDPEAGHRNFAFGHLVIGAEDSPATVVLAGDSGERPTYHRALYLGQLTVHPGSSLDLRGLPVYLLSDEGWTRLQPGTSVGGGEILSSR